MKYFVIEGILYGMTPSVYKKLCKTFPQENRNDGYDYEYTGDISDCLSWIIDNSKMLKTVDVLNF